MNQIIRAKKFDSIIVSFFAFLFIALFTISASPQTNQEFNAPWNNPETPIVIDAYHNNSIDWDELKKDKRVVGIIHKATEGKTFIDRKYQSPRKLAKKFGYKWGSYHLLRRGNIIEQAKFYLSKIGKDNVDELMALDVECSVNSKCAVAKYKVSAKEIKTFLNYIKKETGRYPIFYANQSVIKDLLISNKNDELLKHIPLWYARFKSNVTDFPVGIWKSYSFWQFSSEINCKDGEECLYRVKGTLSDMDVNVYNGTIKELKANWGKLGK